MSPLISRSSRHFLALALVPAAEESRPLLGMLMVAGITALLLAIGLMIYGAGRARARRAEQR